MYPSKLRLIKGEWHEPFRERVQTRNALYNFKLGMSGGEEERVDLFCLWYVLASAKLECGLIGDGLAVFID